MASAVPWQHQWVPWPPIQPIRRPQLHTYWFTREEAEVFMATHPLIVNPFTDLQQARILSDEEQHAYFQRCEICWRDTHRMFLYKLRHISWD